MRPLLIAATLVLAGCTTDQQSCASYGHTPETSDFEYCMSQAPHKALSIGQNSDRYKSQQYGYPYPRPLHCTTRYYDDVAYTDCY